VSKVCLILAASLAALAAPAFARAGGVTLHTHRFDMLAFRWQGGGTVRFRVERAGGRWSAWLTAGDDPTWTGDADRYEVRRSGAVRGLRSTTIWSPVTTPPRARAVADADEPAIAEWQADEEIVRGKPTYAPRIELAVVHHTANTNDYTRAQAAAIVRGIETYHVRGNGWNDIGYNFLVDRYGDVYEGRAGGIEKNVVGAHAEGFNSGTAGIALIGNFATAKPTKAMQDALVELLAWRLDVAHVDPLSTVAYTSGGNAKFKAGTVVTLRAVSGHRDTGPTECPGTAAYALLPALAKRVAATGLPKLYAPTVAGALGGPIRFQARLSSSLAWTVSVANAGGAVVARGRGTGSVVDWTWRSPTGRGSYTWTIAAPGVRVATGTFGVKTKPTTPPPAVALTSVSATLSKLTFTLGAAAEVTAQLDNSAGAAVLTIADSVRPAGADTIAWSPGSLPAGDYRLVVTATAGGASVTKWVDLVLDRSVTSFTATPGAHRTTSFSVVLAQGETVRLVVERGDAIVAEVFSGPLPTGATTISWDDSGFAVPLAAGGYTAVLTVQDALGAVPYAVPLTLG
jgi:hypothetical protein